MTIFGVALLSAALFFGGGLVVGWLFLPVPGFVKRIFGKE